MALKRFSLKFSIFSPELSKTDSNFSQILSYFATFLCENTPELHQSPLRPLDHRHSSMHFLSLASRLIKLSYKSMNRSRNNISNVTAPRMRIQLLANSHPFFGVFLQQLALIFVCKASRFNSHRYANKT